MEKFKIVASEVGGSLQASVPLEAWTQVRQFWKPSEKLMFSFLASKASLGDLFADLDKGCISEAMCQAVRTQLTQISPGSQPTLSATTRFYPLTKPSSPGNYSMGNYATEITMAPQEATMLRSRLLAPTALPQLLIEYSGLDPIPVMLHSRIHPHPNNAYHVIAFDPMDAGLDPRVFEHIDMARTFDDIAWRGYITPSMITTSLDHPNMPGSSIPKWMRDQVKPSSIVYITSGPGPMRFPTAPRKEFRIILSGPPSDTDLGTSPLEFNIPIHKLLNRASLSKPDIAHPAWARVAASKPTPQTSARRAGVPHAPHHQKPTDSSRKRTRDKPTPEHLEQKYQAVFNRLSETEERKNVVNTPSSSTPNGAPTNTSPLNQAPPTPVQGKPTGAPPGAPSTSAPVEISPLSERPIPTDPVELAGDAEMSGPSEHDLHHTHASSGAPSNLGGNTQNDGIPPT